MRTWTGLIGLLLAGGCAAQDPVASARRAVAGGEPDDGHPAVGRLRVGGTPRCGATLVGAQTAVTSAHCLAGGTTFDILLDSGDTFAVTQAIPHPAYGGDGDFMAWGGTRFNDIAVLLLASATSVTPLALSAEPARRGLPVVLVGYGSTACTVADAGSGVDATPTCDEAGTKRRAENTVHEVFQHEFSIVGNGNACLGDSGSPLLATVGQQQAVVGIPARGQIPCGELSYATRLDAFVAWVVDQTGDNVQVVGTPNPPTDGSTADAATPAGDAGGPTGDAGRLTVDGAIDPADGDLHGGCGLALAGAFAGAPGASFLLVILIAFQRRARRRRR